MGTVWWERDEMQVVLEAENMWSKSELKIREEKALFVNKLFK